MPKSEKSYMKVLVEWSHCNRISFTDSKVKTLLTTPQVRLYQSICEWKDYTESQVKVSECFHEMTGEKGSLQATSC